jgi:hypothetical protein
MALAYGVVRADAASWRGFSIESEWLMLSDPAAQHKQALGRKGVRQQDQQSSLLIT